MIRLKRLVGKKSTGAKMQRLSRVEGVDVLAGGSEISDRPLSASPPCDPKLAGFTLRLRYVVYIYTKTFQKKIIAYN
jgi:hypothetical protein